MPLPDANRENFSNTFTKNTSDLNNLILYGILFQQMIHVNTDAEGNFREEDMPALGFTNNFEESAQNFILDNAANFHMPDKSYASFQDTIHHMYEATNRQMLAEAALYQQVLDALPEDEPNREEKAMYLFSISGLQDNASPQFLMDFEAKAVGMLQKGIDPFLEGANHGGNWRETTIGEILDWAGYDDAKKQEFLKRHDFASLNETLYDSEIRRKPDHAGKPDDQLRANLRTHIGVAFTKDAKRYAEQQVRKKSSPEESRMVAEYEKLIPKMENGGNPEAIRDWIKGKGKKLVNDLSKARMVANAQKSRLRLESGESLSPFSTNTPNQQFLDTQKKETAYITDLVSGKKTGEQVMKEFIEKGKKELPGLECKTARQFINEIRRNCKEKAYNVDDEEHPYKPFATIFAARILSDSVRGKKDTLDEFFNRNQLDALADSLMDNRDFNDFINENYLDDEPEYKKLHRAESKLASAGTHGGFIEDEFKKFLLKKKPGELENSPELARYMPTARERIEELKRQVRKNPDDLELQEAAAAEIIAIRNACKVERKSGYGLDKPIPPAEEGKRIDTHVRKLTQNNIVSEVLRDDDTRRELLSRNSHGGALMIRVRNEYDSQVEPENRRADIVSVLNKNTVGERLQELREEAREINEKLHSPKAIERTAAMEKSKSVLGEYMTLVTHAKNPQGLQKDVPWKEADSVVKSTMRDPTAGEMMKTPATVSEMMNTIAAGDIGAFKTKFSREYSAATAPKENRVPERVQQQELNIHGKAPEKNEAVHGLE